jgi:hypothetical protein
MPACVTQGPETVARGWYDALAKSDGNRLAELTCRNEQGNLSQGTLGLSLLNLVGQSVLGESTKLDLSGLTYRIVKTEGDTAYIEVRGQFSVAILTFSQTHDYRADLIVVKEDGAWKVCGEGSAGQADAKDKIVGRWLYEVPGYKDFSIIMVFKADGNLEKWVKNGQTIGLEEKGRWRIAGNFLYTGDGKGNENASEFTVDADTLTIGNDNNRSTAKRIP